MSTCARLVDSLAAPATVQCMSAALPSTATPLELLDALTFAVGPQAAFPDRRAVLGQRLGSRVFVPFGSQVLCQLRGDAADALASAAVAVVVPRSLRRDRDVFVRAVLTAQPMPQPLCFEFLLRLAADRLEVSSEVRGVDAVTARVAAEELVVACYEVLGMADAQVTSAPLSAPRRVGIRDRLSVWFSALTKRP